MASYFSVESLFGPVCNNNAQLAPLFGYLCQDLKRKVYVGKDVRLWLIVLNAEKSTMGCRWLAAFKICQRIFEVQNTPESVNQYMQNLLTWQNPFSWNLEVFALFRFCVEVWANMKRINGTCAPKVLEIKTIELLEDRVEVQFKHVQHELDYDLSEAKVYVCEFIANMYRKKQDFNRAWHRFSQLLASHCVEHDLKRRASLLEHFAKMILEIYDSGDVSRPTMIETLKLKLHKCPWAGALMDKLNELHFHDSFCVIRGTSRQAKALISLGDFIIESACDTLAASASSNFYMHFLLCCTRVKLLLLRLRVAPNDDLETCVQTQVSKLRHLRKDVLRNHQGNFDNITREINDLNTRLRRLDLNHLCIEKVACSNCVCCMPFCV